MLVSIIIPAYNAAATLAECLEACLAQTYPEVEVIVVDDGSTDQTPRIARSFPIHYARQENAGPAAARNRGAAEAAGSVLAFTDADCVPETQWIARLVAGFAEGAAGVGGTYGIANPHSLLARMVHEEIAVRHGQFGAEVDFLGSFNVAYRKEAFDAAGGFDDSFTRASGEDNDLAYRLRGAGNVLRFAKDAVVAHYHPECLWPYLRTQARHGYWRMKLYAKHPGRARSGDQYAGPADLAGPPLSLVLLGMAPVTASTAFWPRAFATVSCLTLALFIIYLLLHVSKPIAMARRTGDARMLLFAFVLALRDLARALGMAKGAWTLFARKENGA